MEKFLSDLVQNKNFIMLSISIVYILGLYAFFTEIPIVFSAVFTLIILLLLLKINNIKLLFIYLFMFYFGFFYSDFRVKLSDDLFEKAPSVGVVSGYISSVPIKSGNDKIKFFFSADTYDNKKVSAKTLVTVKLPPKSFSDNKYLIGNYYKINGKLRKPFVPTNPSQFSYSKYLRNYGCYTTFYTEDSMVKNFSHKLSPKYKLLQYLNLKREDVIKSHSKYLKSPNIEILGGVVFGDDAIAPPEYVKTSFIHSGLLHILAASGMNVAFISGFLLFFLSRLNVYYRLRLLCAIVSVIFYALMTGLGASVVRASLMLIFVFLGKLIDRDTHSISLLSFVALLMLLYNPSYINDVGFQLSFIVTFGILVSANSILKYFDKLPAWLTGSVFIPVIAQIWVIPIQMFYFNTISVYSVFANIISMPFLTVISCGGFTSSVLALCPVVADFVCKIFDIVLNPCINSLVFISEFFSKLPHSIFVTTHPSVVQIVIYYIILLLVIWLLEFDFKNKKVIITVCSLALILFLSSVVKLPNTNFEAIAFEVGNADAFLLKTPSNRYYMIDTGKMGYDGGKSQAEIIILKYLKDKGIKTLDGLIITHYDSDHAGGAIDLIKNVRIKTVYVASLDDKKHLSKMITRTIKANPYATKELAKDGKIICSERIKDKNFEMKLIKPDMTGTDAQNSDNENSVMTLVKYGKNKMLFTGDGGVKELERAKYEIPSDITVFKVGHHGARGVVDKPLAAYLNPKISLVSVGFNKYGHPNAVTLKLLDNSKILRTDKVNSVRIIFDKNDNFEADGFNPRTHKYYLKYKGSL